MDQLTFTSTPTPNIPTFKTHFLISTDSTTLVLECHEPSWPEATITSLTREQMLDLHAALASQLGFTD
jgi:hypothetical protein